MIDRDEMILCPLQHTSQKPQLKSVVVSRDILSSLRTPPSVALFDADKVALPYKLRHWKVGDRFQPFGMKGSKLVSDYFSDNKFSLYQKQQTWVLVDANDAILWLVGYRADGRCSVTPSTVSVLRVEVV